MVNARKIPPELASTSVYDGRLLIGFLVDRGNGQIEAALADGQALGLFTNARRQGGGRC
jgi:hypothetical protein